MELGGRLVIARGDVGGLAWGASNLGGGANGDFLYFDSRYDYSAAHAARLTRGLLRGERQRR